MIAYKKPGRKFYSAFFLSNVASHQSKVFFKKNLFFLAHGRKKKGKVPWMFFIPPSRVRQKPLETFSEAALLLLQCMYTGRSFVLYTQHASKRSRSGRENNFRHPLPPFPPRQTFWFQSDISDAARRRQQAVKRVGWESETRRRSLPVSSSSSSSSSFWVALNWRERKGLLGNWREALLLLLLSK